MKMKPADLNALERLLNEVITRHGPAKLAAHADMLRKLPISQNVDKRYRWDLWWSIPAADRLPFLDHLYTYLDDSHIDTALRYLVETPASLENAT